MGSVLLSPTSVGSIKLATSNIWDSPIIDTAFMSTAFDRYAMEVAIAETKRIAAAPAYKGYIGAPYGAFADTNTTAQVLTYIESWVAPIWQ